MKTLLSALSLVLAWSVTAAAEPATPGAAGAPADPLSAHPSPVESAGRVTVHGKVLETMDAAGYTYVRVASGDAEIWAAGPRTTVAVGDTVSFPRGVAMKDFHSDTLDRTFESIAFVSAITVASSASGAAAPAPAKAAPQQAADESATEVSGIERAEGGKTIAEIFEQKDELAGEKVLLRAKVVKLNRGIMARNWLHLRDGTKAAGGQYDLTVTSSEAAEVGATVLVRGTVALNKDFGFGYQYDVLLEDATITPE